VVDAEAYNICNAVKECSSFHPRTVSEYDSLRRQILHFGYLYLFSNGGYARVHQSNKVAVTFYHGDRSDPGFRSTIDVFLREICRVDKVVVPCLIMRNRLMEWGVPEEKVALIPIGVDLSVFSPRDAAQRTTVRKELGIPDGRFVIGSFQKDGVGWEEGLAPKWIKGPDTFLKVLELLSPSFPVTVLLTGPARGYMKQGLERLRLPYKHVHFKTPEEVAQCYHALDLYLVTSREEGGPKAVMESMASGVPLVSTRVGMAADLIRDGENGFVCEIEDIASLAARAHEVLSDAALGRRFATAGLVTATKYDYAVIGRRHVDAVYAPLLAELKR